MSNSGKSLSQRKCLLLFIIVALSALIIGCGPRLGAGDLAAAAGDKALVVDLPAFYIDYDVNGIPYAGATPLADLGAAFGEDLAMLTLDPARIARLTAANIQHLQLLNTPAGVVALVNGQPLPTLQWNEAMLTSTAQLFHALDGGASLVESLLPLASELGVGLVVRFPVAPGVPLVSLGDVSDETAIATANETEVVAAASQSESQGQSDQEAYLALIGAPPQLSLTITYTADGAWTLSHLTANGWAEATSAPWSQLNLPPTLLQKISAAGIKTMTITSNRQGATVTINDQPLPSIHWAQGEVDRLMELTQQLGLFDTLLKENPNAAVMIDTVQQLLPFAQTLEVNLTVHFP